MRKTLYIVLCLFPFLFSSCRKTTSGIPAGAVQMWSQGTRSIYVADDGKSVWLSDAGLIGTSDAPSLKLALTGASYEFLPVLDKLSDELLAVAKDEKKKLLPVQ